MGQVVTHASFSHEPIVNTPVTFTARRIDILRRINISESTLRRWEVDGRLYPYDAQSGPEGQYVFLPSGRKRYSYERVLATAIGGIIHNTG